MSDLFATSPICTLIKSKTSLEELAQDLSDEIKSKELVIKEDPDYPELAIIYSNNESTPGNKIKSTQDVFVNPLISSARSIILEKVLNKNNMPEKLNVIGTQFNNIVYNQDAEEYIKSANWDAQIIVQRCYEGTILLVYYSNNKWHVSTRRCIDSNKSIWIKDYSYRIMFAECQDKLFTFDDLNKKYCYQFLMIHHKNKNMVNYNDLGLEYKKLLKILVTEKNTLKEIDVEVKNVESVKQERFINFEDMLEELKKINTHDENRKLLSCEGYVIRVYQGEKFKSAFKNYKIQTPLYQKLFNMKPNNSNPGQCYLELFCKGELEDYIKYFPDGLRILDRVATSLETVACDMYNLYFLTRRKNNANIYENLDASFKKILYAVHGEYIKTKIPVTESSIFDYLVSLPMHILRNIFNKRIELIKDSSNIFLDRSCVYVTTQTALMLNLEGYDVEKLEDKVVIHNRLTASNNNLSSPNPENNNNNNNNNKKVRYNPAPTTKMHILESSNNNVANQSQAITSTASNNTPLGPSRKFNQDRSQDNNRTFNQAAPPRTFNQDAPPRTFNQDRSQDNNRTFNQAAPPRTFNQDRSQDNNRTFNQAAPPRKFNNNQQQQQQHPPLNNNNYPPLNTDVKKAGGFQPLSSKPVTDNSWGRKKL